MVNMAKILFKKPAMRVGTATKIYYAKFFPQVFSFFVELSLGGERVS